MYCKKCGKQIEDDSEFCRYCGTLQLEKGADASAKKAVDDTQDIQGFFSEKEKEQRRKMVKSHEAATKKKKTIITVVVSIILSVAAISLILFGYILPNAHLQFKYELIEDEYYYITGYRGSDKNIIIPETIFGKPVTGIAGYAFKDNDNIRSVTFGENMAMIGASAFEDCGALSSVEFKDDPNNNPHYILWERAFANCTDLQSVRFAVSGYYSVLSGCFENCTKLKNITYNGDAKRIYDRAFNGCVMLEYVTMHDNIEKVGDRAFQKFFAVQQFPGKYVPKQISIVQNVLLQLFCGNAHGEVIQPLGVKLVFCHTICSFCEL